jgi:ADP-ribose pyrophosphatase
MARFIRGANRIVYQNPWLRFERFEITHPNGTAGEHGLVITPPAAGVIAFDGEDVWLTRQQRFALDRSEIEIVKGGAAAGESHLAAAQRELREELGLTARRWDSLGEALEIPSIMQEPVLIYLAREISRVETDQEAVESIDAVHMSLAAALDALASGAISDAVTAVALFRAARLLGRA